MPTHSPDHFLELRLLGGFDARLNGHPIAGFTYNKMRALLAYLAVEREQDHNREALAALLWGSNDLKTARGNLRRTLFDLRRVLELPGNQIMFTSGKHTIRYIQNGYVDALDFTGNMPASAENHVKAGQDEEKKIALYTGEFLAGLSLPDSPDFEDWLQIQRESMHRRTLAMLERLSNRYEQAANYSKALQFALRFTELEPWNEEAHRSVIRLYALDGQSSAAIVQYEACCRLLRNELGVLPSEETRILVGRVRSGELSSPPITGKKIVASRFPVLQATPQLQAERRQVTVLYCELTIAAIDDPDDAMELLHAPQACCVEIIRQYSGHIVQTHGGGLLAYFGYPQAREDAARRAVQAALAVTQESAKGIEIRAGVHTGLVITGGELAMPDTSGRTSKLAMQLRQNATHNEVVISQETHAIVAGYFDCKSFGVQFFSSMAKPQEIFKVLQESGARTRLDASAQLTPLTGRKTEIAKLLKLWKSATQGSRQVVLIQGEAGIGKSRLLHTLKERLADQPHAVRELRCFPEFSRSPFYPLIVMLEAIFGFVPGDTSEIKFGKLANYLEAHYPATAQKSIPLLAELLSLPLVDDYQAPGFSPQKQKEQTQAILLGLLQTLAMRQPLLLILEDLHWIDPSTLELLTLFVEQTGKAPILVLLTARPEFIPPWQHSIKVTMTLAPLVEDEVAEMIASLRIDIPAETIRRIAERTDGVPLFVEEVAKIATQDSRASIPTTLHDLLATRIDQMGEAKYTAQFAATLGREFDLNLLRRVSFCDSATLAHNLNALAEAGLILKLNETSCQFKHALIQEAAYQSQTKADRQAAHQRIAQALQNAFVDLISTRPELLAQHLGAGGETRPAVEYWIKAGQRAALHSANTEAIEHFNNGLQLLMTLPSEKERDQAEAELRLNFGTVLLSARGYGSVESGQMYSRSLELCEQLCDGVGLYKALWGMWLTSSSRIDHLHSLELAEKLLQLAQHNNEPLSLQFAHYAIGNSLLWAGQLEKSRFHFEQAIALYQPSHHANMVRNFGENACVSNDCLLSWVLWLQGYPEQAVAVINRALSLARQTNHPYSLGFALCCSAILHRWLRQVETTSQLALEALSLSQKHGLPFSLGVSVSSYGWVMAMLGQVAGVPQIQQCLAAASAIMSGTKLFFYAMLIEARIPLGQIEQALVDLDEALTVVNEKEDHFCESEFHRLKGVCLLEISANNAAEAEICFDRALTISRRQGAKSLELRATISMAQLWQQQSQQEDARRSLQDIYSLFTEGRDTPDLLEAAILLNTLS
jgi:predicted ATPase/DNA-binding SARP family transcriptional activator